MKQQGVANQCAYTVIEMVMVLVIMGILMVYAVPKFTSSGELEAKALMDELLSGASYAQQLAMANGDNVVQMQLSTNGYSVLIGGQAITRPYGGSYPFQVANPDIQISNTPTTVRFNHDGNSVNALGTPVAVTVTVIGPITLIACIEPTGYAHAGNCH